MESDNKGPSQAVALRGNENLYVAGVYIGPQTTAKATKETLNQPQGKTGRRTAIVRDLNARHSGWYRVSNESGTGVVKWASERNKVVTTADSSSYWTRGTKGEKKPDLLID